MNRTLARQLSRVCDIDSESACIALLEQAQALAAQAGTPPELAAFLAEQGHIRLFLPSVGGKV